MSINTTGFRMRRRVGVPIILLILLGLFLTSVDTPTAQAGSGLCDSSPVASRGERAHGLNIPAYAQIGDYVLVGGANSGAWGQWCHAGIWSYYNGKYGIWEATPERQVAFTPVDDWWFWNNWKNAVKVSIKRVWTDGKTREYAAYWASTRKGVQYTVGTNKYSLSFEYCSKLVWDAYRMADSRINLDHNGGPFVVPDDIYNSTWSWLVKYQKG
ncbi:MAG: hypothetical protein JWP00_1936 [Chloroflexi bacterium]|jgi:hypothetical protein|nr:hypothetical protein [Chloroflexota bacterium]